MSYRFGAAILATLVTGCVQYRSTPVSPVQSLATFEARSLSDPGFRVYYEANLDPASAASAASTAWPPSSWELRQLTLAAFYFHPDLDVARARLAMARGGVKIAGERPNPTLTVTPARNSTSLIPSPWLVSAALDIPLETAGKRGYRVEQSKHLSEAARLNIATAAWQVRSRLRKCLLDFHVAEESVTLLQQQQRVQMAILKVLEGQLGAGAASVFEVTQARIATDTTGLTLRDAERQVVETRSLLASSLGLPGTALDGVNFSFAVFTNSPAASPSVDARRQALLNRPDLLGALAEYAASDSALRLQIAKQYPDVHLNPGYEFDQGDNKWLLGLTISLPVLNQNRGAIAEAEARRSETAALFAGLQARIIGELDRAVAGYGASLDKVEMAEALRMKLYRQEKTTQVLIEAGELSRLALFTSQLELSSNALVRLGALAQVQQALGQLEDVLQSPVGLSESLWLASPQRGTAAKDIKHE